MYADVRAVMKRKVGIVTWCDNVGKTNYGQILQCYAIHSICDSLELDPVIIQYRKKSEMDFYQGKFSLDYFNKIYELLFKILIIEKKYDKRIYLFRKFIRNNLNLSIPCYDKGDIEKAVKNCDIYICGSDQIWNPTCFDPMYFLGFGNSDIKRVAYAPSGISFEDPISNQIYRKMVPWINKIDYVSVREEKSAAILKKYTEKRIENVLDPTLLLDKKTWDKVAAARLIKEPYILCYTIGSMRPHKLVIKALMNKYNVKKVIYIPSNIAEDRMSFAEAFDSAGPAEFISLIKYANAVCTDSFHGTAISIKYEKQFYILKRIHKNLEIWTSSDRVDNILDKLNIGKRTLRCIQDVKNIIDIDYKEVDANLDIEIDKSKSFIINAIS